MKKNLLKWMTIMMVTIVSVNFVSCGGDDAEGKENSGQKEIAILGTWYSIEGADVVSYQYNTDGTGIYSHDDVMVKFSYSYDANAKRLTQIVMGVSYVYEITTLTANLMVGKNMASGGIRTFTREEPEKPVYMKGGILYVNVYEAGVFPNLIDSRKTSTTRMKISGSLNGTDIISLQEMMSSDKGGKLVYLDMSDVSIVEGGEPYFRYYEYYITTQNNIISKNMFKNCDVIQELILPNSVVKISHYMFGDNSSNIHTITIGQSTIGSIDHEDLDVQESLNVLAWQNKLEEINVHPDNPKYSSENGVMFSKDKTILYHVPQKFQRNLSLPSSLTTIGYCAFLYYNASSIKLPGSVKKLRNCAFYSSLFRSIDLGESLEEVGEGSLSSCEKLESIYIGTPVPPTASSDVKSCEGVFYRYDSSYRNIKLYVPKGSKEKYASTIPWSELNIIEN